MLNAERMIAGGLVALSIYFMIHATVLPVGWNGMTGGPGGGAFPFWLSAIMGLCAAGILARSVTDGRAADKGPFFDPETRRSVFIVTVALVIAIALIPFAGAYIALPLFVFWYLRIFGGHGWILTAILTLCVPLFVFFFFEVTLKILLPKGFTEPLFFPLYAMFF